MRDRAAINSEICQACARCCMTFHILIQDPDDALRFSRLDTDRIEVRELIKDELWKVVFHYPCINLERVDKRYRCREYGGRRTSYAKDYPFNFLDADTPPEVLEDEMKTCPVLGKLAGR